MLLGVSLLAACATTPTAQLASKDGLECRRVVVKSTTRTQLSCETPEHWAMIDAGDASGGYGNSLGAAMLASRTY